MGHDGRGRQPYALFPWPNSTALVRSAGDPAALAPGVREIVHELDARVPVMDVATLPTLTRRAVVWPRFTMQVVWGFGLVAVLPVALALVAVLSALRPARAATKVDPVEAIAAE